MAGAITSDAADKAARFLQLCDAFGLPVVSLVDTPGMMVGPAAEQAGRGDGDMKIRRDLHQQAHDDEFGGAYSEGTGGDSEEGNGHDVAYCAGVGLQ